MVIGMKKILFTDMDGTLLNNDSMVTGKMKTALDDMCAAGHILVLSSGRPLNSIIQVKECAGIEYPNTYIIANNGSLVYDCDKKEVIHKTTIPLEVVYRSWDIAKEMQIHVQTYQNERLIAKEMNEELKVYTSKVHFEIDYCNHPQEIMTEAPCKMLAIDLDNHEDLVGYQNRLQSEFKGLLQTVFSTPQYLEIFHKDAGKGSGLKWLCDYLDIPVSRSYASGDAENDLSMLEVAGFSIAMKNGDEILKNIADVVTEKSNDEYGLADVIYQYML